MFPLPLYSILLLVVHGIPYYPKQHPLGLNRFDSSKEFLEYAASTLSTLSGVVNEAVWSYETNITDANSDASSDASLVYNKALLDIMKRVPLYQGDNEEEVRQLAILKLMGGVPKDPVVQKKLNGVTSRLVDLYATSTFNGRKVFTF